MVTVTSPRVRQVAGAQLRYTRVRRTCPGWWTQRPASHTAAHPHSSSLAHSALGSEDTEVDVAVVVVVLSVEVRVVSVVDVTIFVVVVVVGVVLVAPAATVKVSASVSVVVVADVVGIVAVVAALSVVVVAVVVVVVIVVVVAVAVTAFINNAVEVAIVVATEDVKVRGLNVVDVASGVDVLLLLHVPSEQIVDDREKESNHITINIYLRHHTTEFPGGSDSLGASSHCSGLCSFSLMLSLFVLLLLLYLLVML